MRERLPDTYQPYVHPVARPAPVEVYDEADPIVHVPDPYDPNRFVEVRRSALQPVTRTMPRDLSPQPLFDPLAQRLESKSSSTANRSTSSWRASASSKQSSSEATT